MKNKTVKIFLLGITIIASIYVVPKRGQNSINQTDVAAQTESTIEKNIKVNTTNTVNAGITETLFKALESHDVSNLSKSQCVTVVTTESIEQKIYVTGYCKSDVNVRTKPNTDSEILEVYSFNQEVEYTNYNEEWVEIKYGDSVAYININYINNEKLQYLEYSVPSNRGFKSFMPYKAITSKSSPQYKLQYNYAYTGNYGIRQIDGRYCVALGTAFNASVGTYVDLVLANGTVIPCILSDVKADCDTESNNIVTAHNGCVSEFLVDKSVLESNAKRDGDISSCQEDWKSPVVTVRVYDQNVIN